MGCTIAGAPALEPWLSDIPGAERACAVSSSMPPFAEVSRHNRAIAAARLETSQALPISKEEAVALTGNVQLKTWRKPHLIRALRTEPADGQFTVTICGDTLFVSYVAPPTRLHRRIRRCPLVIELTEIPLRVVINAAEGVS